jgi:hypothetical protein
MFTNNCYAYLRIDIKHIANRKKGNNHKCRQSDYNVKFISATKHFDKYVKQVYSLKACIIEHTENATIS